MTTYPQVNLLKKSERRYQGVVSRSFIFVGIVGVPIVVVAAVSAVILYANNQVEVLLKSAQMRWNEVKGPQETCLKLQAELAEQQTAIGLLRGWEASVPDWDRVLLEIQREIPAGIQLTRLSIRTAADAASYNKVDALAMKPMLTIQGLAKENTEGSLRAEDEVLKKLLPALNENEFLTVLFEKFELLPGPPKRGDVFEFRIEGRSL